MGLIKSIQVQLKSSFTSLKDSMVTVLEHNKENQPLCKAILDLTHLNYDLLLHKQLEELCLSTNEAINCINYMDEMRNIESSALPRKKLQKLINANPKLAHKEIFKDNNAQPRIRFQAVRDPETNTTEIEPTKQAQIVEKYFSNTKKAVNVKRGKYLPEDAPRNCPWEQANTSSPIPDPFILQSQITKIHPKNSSRESGSTPRSLKTVILLKASKHLPTTNLQAQTAS